MIKCLLAGADVVQIASSLPRHGASHLDRLVAGLAEWIEAHNAGSVNEIRGRLRAGRLAQRRFCRARTTFARCCWNIHSRYKSPILNSRLNFSGLAPG